MGYIEQSIMTTCIAPQEPAGNVSRICYLAPVEWNGLWQRPQQLASRLANSYQTVYVDPIGIAMCDFPIGVASVVDCTTVTL